MSKRVSFVVLGLRGDVQPCIVLGHRLQQAGYHVSIATHTNFEEMVRAYNLDYIPLAGDSREIISANQQIFDLKRQGLKAIRAFRETIWPYAQQTLDEIWAISQQTDMLVFNMLAWPTYQILEKRQIPAIFTSVFPLTRTNAYPTVALPLRHSFGKWYNRLSYFFIERVIWLIFRQLINRWRVETLGLPPQHWPGFIEDFYKKQIPVLYAYSPAISSAPPDWPENYHVTGYWFWDTPPNWQPSQALVDFIAAGAPPVYIGFGSMNCQTDHDVLTLIRDALRLSEQRAILSRGWSDLPLESGLIEDNIFLLDSVPHAWLFPQMAAVVHHGGCGTTTAALRAGAPTITTPFFVDQPFWGQRSVDLGVGVVPAPYKKLTAEKLANAIRQVTGDAEVQDRATQLATSIQTEDGIAEAVRIIKNMLGEER